MESADDDSWWQPTQTMFNLIQSQQEATAKVFRMADLPPFSLRGLETHTHHIIAYLKRLLSEFQQMDAATCLILPSLDALIGLFGSSQQEVRLALKELKRDGYDSFIPGLYGPISVWNQPSTSAQESPAARHQPG